MAEWTVRREKSKECLLCVPVPHLRRQIAQFSCNVATIHSPHASLINGLRDFCPTLGESCPNYFMLTCSSKKFSCYVCCHNDTVLEEKETEELHCMLIAPLSGELKFPAVGNVSKPARSSHGSGMAEERTRLFARCPVRGR